jgi:hypothetical protein
MKVGEITHCDCGHDVVYDGGCTAGYGVDREGKKICNACCGENDKRELERGFQVVLYLSKDNKGQYKVTSWPGTFSILPTYVKSREVWAGYCGSIDRTDVWFSVGRFKFWGFIQGDNQCFMPRVVK